MPKVLRVYEWPDGSYVTVNPDLPEDGREFSLHVEGLPWDSSFVFEDDERVMVPWHDPEARRKLHPEEVKKWLGFLLDLGVNHPKTGRRSSLVFVGSNEDPTIPCPRWLPDDRWARRYKEAIDHVLYDDPDASENGVTRVAGGSLFLGHVRDLQIGKVMDEETKTQIEDLHSDLEGKGGRSIELAEEIDSLERSALFQEDDLERVMEDLDIELDLADLGPWRVEWEMSRGPLESVRSTLREVVDDVISMELLLPESVRSALETANVDRGTFVAPSADEVEVFWMLGEENPLLWQIQKFLQWLNGRVS